MAAPARGFLGVGLNTEDNASALAAWAEAVEAQAPYPMSRALLVWRQGGWVER